jgi:hypothetical protein
MTPNEFLSVLQFLSSLMANAPPPAAPPAIDIAASPAEVVESVLRCYHPASRFKQVNVLQLPWERQADWNADSSAVLEIEWNGGFTGNPYRTVVALVRRASAMRGIVLEDDSPVPASGGCALNHWVETQ